MEDNKNSTNKSEKNSVDNTAFDSLNISQDTLDVITKKGFKVASEIQAKIIPVIFEQKHDIIGVAQTGTGKTGAFGLPLVDLIKTGNKIPQAIILAPTRELALQVSAEISSFCGKKRLNILTVYGGSPISQQIKALRRGVDIVVGTPGRVVDLLNRKILVLKESRYFILDEADEMLKMGFIEDIEYVLENSSEKRRVYLFSATMPQRIKQLSKKYMKKQLIIEAKAKKEINKLIEQTFYKAKQKDKFEALSKLIDIEDFFYGIIFCRTKADVNNVTAALKKSGHEVDCIHGDIVQNQRERILNKFKKQQLNILVATDVAARGIDVKNLSHVINYSLPEDVETYTHRIGRTGRAGNSGKAISLATQAEMRRISLIERTLKVKIKSMKLPTEKEMIEKVGKKFTNEVDNIITKVNTSKHSSITDELLEKYEPAQLVNALLHKIHEKNGMQSSNSNNRKSGNSRDSRSSRASNGRRDRSSYNEDVRIFIAKGKMDRMNNRALISFIEKETRVKIGRAKDIKVCDKFSFVTLKANEAHDVVDAFEAQGRRRPLAEIAQN